MAPGLHPADGALSVARGFLGHLSEVPSPWPLACCCVSAGQGAAHAALEAAPENVPWCVKRGERV